MWRLIAFATVLFACGGGGKPASRTPTNDTMPRTTNTPAASSATSPGDPPPPPALGDGGARSQGSGNRCDTAPVGELAIDGLLDDWKESRVVARVGSPSDGAVELHCVWDGTAIAFALDIKDERLIRVKGGTEDKVTISLAAGGKPVAVTVLPGNAMAKAKITKPARVEAADSLQPKGFSVELAIPAAAIPEYSPSTPAFQLDLVFHDSDAATGGDTTPLAIQQPLELPDRKDLLDDFLATVRLKRTDVKLDTLVDLDPDRKGKERIVAGGAVIGVLTDQFAYVTLPAASPADIKKIELLPLGTKGTQIISALVRQTGNGGSRDLLMLWTVWSGQLQPLVNIEVRKELGGNVLETTYAIAKGKKGPELVVESKPAVGFTAESWNEVPAGDSDGILLPWDDKKSGIAYSVKGAEIERRELPKKKKR
jgi:hypothetical protein